MKKLLLLIFICSFCALADQSVYDLIRDNKIAYPLSAKCKTFFTEPAQRKILQSDRIKQALVTPAQLGFNSYFYHYTKHAEPLDLLLRNEKDRNKAQRLIKKKKGYGKIFRHQMTYKDALHNAAGVGFYTSANPISSAGYGPYQVQFKVKANSKVFYHSKNSNIYNQELKKIQDLSSNFANCHIEVRYSVLFDENGVDLVYYNDDREWFVGFNEDIFLESKVTLINSKKEKLIFKKMVDSGELESIINYVDIINPDSKHSLSLSDFLDSFKGDGTNLKDTKDFADFMLKTMPVKTNEASFFSILKHMDMSLVNRYYKRFSSRSTVFAKLLMDSDVTSLNDELIKIYVKSLNGYHKPSNAVLAVSNLQYLLSKDYITSHFFSNQVKSFVNFSDLYKNYSETKYQKGIGALVINDMLQNGQAYFQALSADEKYGIFNYYMKHAKQEDIVGFVSRLNTLSYSLSDSFNWTLDRSSRYNIDNLLAFYRFYLGNNLGLLGDTVVMDKVKSIVSLSKKPDIKLFDLMFNNYTGNEDNFYAHLDIYLKKSPKETIRSVLSSSEIKNFDPLVKRTIYLSILNEHGVNSADYYNFLSLAKVDIQVELAYLQHNYELKAADQEILYNKFRRNSATAKKLAELSGMFSVLYIFKANNPSSKLINTFISDYKKEILPNLSVIKKIRSFNNDAGLAIIKSDDFIKAFDSFSEAKKESFLFEALRDAADISIVKSLIERITLSREVSTRILTYINLNFGRSYNQLPRLLVDNSQILLKAEKKAFTQYFGLLVRDKSILDLHKTIFRDSKFPVGHLVSGINFFHRLSNDFFIDVLVPKLKTDTASLADKAILIKYYSKHYSSSKRVTKYLWPFYFNELKGDTKLLLTKLRFESLEISHRKDVLRELIDSESKIVEFDKELSKSTETAGYNYNFNIAVFKSKDSHLIKKNIARIDRDYPAKNKYIDSFMNYYLSKSAAKFMRDHAQNKLCKRINKYSGLKKWSKRYKNKIEKRERRQVYKVLCK